MWRLAALGVCLLVACGGAHRPSKGDAAQELDCKRRGLTMSETLEDAWTSQDQRLHVRHRVGVSCTKSDESGRRTADLWQECTWDDDDWLCGAWTSDPVTTGPAESTPHVLEGRTTYLPSR